MEKEIQPLLLIKTNQTKYDKISSSITVSSSLPIVENAEDYYVEVNKAELPIRDIPLDIITENYVIYIDCAVEGHAKLEKGLNKFEINGSYFTVQEFLNKVNSIIHTGISPSSLGTFALDPTDDLIEYKSSPFSERADLTLYFDEPLMYLLQFDGINFYSASYDPSMLPYKLYSLTLGTSESISITKQIKNTINRFYNFKQIRIRSTLPTIPFIVVEDLSYTNINNSDILIDISLNSENYNPNLTTWTLIPTTFRKFQLTGTSEIQFFNISVYIYYSNGQSYQLMLSPKEFMSITLTFLNKKHIE